MIAVADPLVNIQDMLRMFAHFRGCSTIITTLAAILGIVWHGVARGVAGLGRPIAAAGADEVRLGIGRVALT